MKNISDKRKQAIRDCVARRRQTLKEAGLIKVEVYVCPDHSELIRDYAKRLNEHARKEGKILDV